MECKHTSLCPYILMPACIFILPPSPPSVDGVSDRDFVIELLSANAIIGVHMSRLAEEWVLWATEEFGFITPSDRVSTGSSIMPQKKNPDPMEIVRGKSARVIGDLTTLLVLCKGLPLAYNRDLQVRYTYSGREANVCNIGVVTIQVLGLFQCPPPHSPPPSISARSPLLCPLG